jgi:SAM-dependent MidA family methyltransferase
VHVVRIKDGELQEAYVTERDGRLCEEFDEPSCPALEKYIKQLGRPPEGWRGEVCLAALAWLERVNCALTEGTVLTIDYGATWAELCSARWVGGTLACYYRHQLGRNPYDRIGEQDITAHVNFSALRDFGERLGLRTASIQLQAEYLIDLGIGDELTALTGLPPTAETMRAKRAITDLIWPDGLGGFRVLVQRKGEA